MKCVYILFVVSLMMSSFICSEGTITSEFLLGDIYNTWVHSYEEQDAYYPQLYRPIDYKEFGDSRFRMQYTFNQDSSCQWMVADPGDAHYLQSGTFLRKEQTVLIYDIDGTFQENISFKIINLKHDLLEIERIK
jgi:hypothetical protein